MDDRECRCDRELKWLDGEARTAACAPPAVLTARFDVHRAPGSDGYLLDIESDPPDGLTTCVVVPLMSVEDAHRRARILNLVIELSDGPHVLVTQFLSAIPASLLGTSTGELADRSDGVTVAVDSLFRGS